ncbi:MAG: AAC(3) family N-acetyltransferase [Vicinamibacterales bacterium]
MKTPPPVSKSEVIAQLRRLGVPRGSILLVHTAFSRVRPIEDGPRGLIDALLEAAGVEGTLVMPSMSDDDDHPFDPAATPCDSMGVVASTFWKMPGVLRSNSPHAFAAVGPRARDITRDHPIDVPHGLDSPVGRVHELDGWVLLLGVGHDADTTVHLSENVAGVRYRTRKYATVSAGGRPVRVEYDETDHCCRRFALLDDWLAEREQQRRGRVGYGEARLARSRDIVRVAVDRLRANDLVFLHQAGACAECDEARASLQ